MRKLRRKRPPDDGMVLIYGDLMPKGHVQAICKAVMNDYDARPAVYADENWRNDPTYNLRRKPKP